MKAILYSSETLSRLYLGDVPKPVPAANEVLVETRATALNRADIAQKQGKYPPPAGASDILGLEATGIIIAVGSDCKKFSVGDEVIALLAGGGYGEFFTCPEGCLMHKPRTLSWEEAAGVAETFITAYQALFSLGKLVKGQTALIHGGASGVGSSAIQLAHSIGATVIATAGSDEKCRFLEQKLGVHKAINYKTARFAEQVKASTDKQGVQFILDIAGGSHYEQNMRCIGIDGRWVVLAFMGGRYAEKLDFAQLLMKRVTLMGSTLRARSNATKAALITGFTERFMPLLADKKIAPVIDKIYSWQDAQQAHEYMEANQNIGKIILKTGN